jgi:cytoskeletal protein CcmA (bactofilin family)
VNGELSASEDLVVEGLIEGKIELRNHVLTIGPRGRVKAQVFAKAVIIYGQVTGIITASERVEIRDNGMLDGDISAPRIALADGAYFRGSIDMQRTPGMQPKSSLGLRHAPLTQTARMEVEVYIPAADPTTQSRQLERLQHAVTDLLGTFGYEPEPESVSLTHASWHWKEWFRRTKPQVQQEVSEVYDEVKEALRRQHIDAVGAAAFEKRAKAAADLLKSFEPYDAAIARLGDVVIVKAVVKGQRRVAIETVSPPLARELERNPGLMRDPAAFLALLDSGGSAPTA